MALQERLVLWEEQQQLVVGAEVLVEVELVQEHLLVGVDGLCTNVASGRRCSGPHTPLLGGLLR